MDSEWYRLEISGRINGGYIVRIERDELEGFVVVAHQWVIFPPSVQAGTGRIDGKVVSQLRTAVESCRFWELPTEGSSVGFDGTFYHLDVFDRGRIHRVVRWSGATAEGVGINKLVALLREIGRVATGVGG